MSDEKKVAELDGSPVELKVEEEPVPSVNIGWVEDPAAFDVGTDHESNPIIMFYDPSGVKRALGFKGPAGEKLLTSMYGLLAFLYGTIADMEESSEGASAGKKHTLH